MPREGVDRRQEGDNLALWIDQDQRAWNVDAVNLVVASHQVENVLNTELPLNPRADILRWPFTKDDRVSVKTSYQQLKHLNRSAGAGNQSLHNRDL